MMILWEIDLSVPVRKTLMLQTDKYEEENQLKTDDHESNTEHGEI